MRRRNIALIVGGVILAVVIIIAIAIKSNAEDFASFSSSYYTSCDKKHNNTLRTFASAAVSSDGSPCAQIAKEVFVKGGAAADAAIAAFFCVGVINAQSSGLGGGFLATFYSKAEGKAYCLDAREVAPAAATKDMFMDHPKKGRWWDKKKSASHKGGLAVAVPGESVGLYELYKRFGGKVAWRDLIEPSVKLCQEGYKLTWYTGGILNIVANDIRAEPTMSEIFMKEGRLLHEGDTVKRPLLAKTLRALQDNPYELSNGTLAKKLAEDLQEFDGIITPEDLSNYRPTWRQPVHFKLQNKGYSLHSFPPPGSGLLVGLILNILDNYNISRLSLRTEEENTLLYHRIAEAFKFAFAKRSLLGDLPQEKAKEVINQLTDEALALSLREKISDEKTFDNLAHYGAEVISAYDEGTAHLSLVSPDGDAVSITGSINYGYGAGIRSKSTGIILNNQMADFETVISETKIPGELPYNKNNIVVPGHRPLSSMSPSVVVDSKGDVQLVIGAAGGTMIPTSISWVAVSSLWLKEDIKDALDTCRIHHQLHPMKLRHDIGFPNYIKNGLEDFGHEMEQLKWKSVVVAIARNRNGELQTAYDFRKSGEVDGL